MEAVETLLTGVDAATQRAFREQQRTWRTEDVQYRECLRDHSMQVLQNR